MLVARYRPEGEMTDPSIPASTPRDRQSQSTPHGILAALVDALFRLGIVAALAIALLIAHDYSAHAKALADHEATTAEQQHGAQVAREERAYRAKRRSECYDIYARERGHFGNVKGLDYDEDADRCEVIYHQTRGTPALCVGIKRDTSGAWITSPDRFIRNLRFDCADNNFRNEF
jgi:hypothetical protein